jgi:hypothetical protein
VKTFPADCADARRFFESIGVNLQNLRADSPHFNLTRRAKRFFIPA